MISVNGDLVASSTPDVGSVFTLLLPIATNDPAS